MVFTLDELAERVNGRVQGDGSIKIYNVATLSSAKAGDISFLANARYRSQLLSSAASAVIVSVDDAKRCPVAALRVDNPYLAYARIATLLNPPPRFEPTIHDTAVLDSTSQVDSSAHIGPHVVVGANVIIKAGVCVGPGCVIDDSCTVGIDTRLSANVTLCRGTQVGDRGLLHPGAVLGADGFGLANDQGRWVKVPQIGRVIIGDDVEIGANTTIDRGALEDTVIEDGVKLDNLIQVAHNVRIGAHTAIAACVGIAGTTRIGRYCMIGGGVGITGHLDITDNVQITAMSLVTKSIKSPGIYSTGTPLQENAKWRRSAVRFKQLEDMARRLHELENIVQGKG